MEKRKIQTPFDEPVLSLAFDTLKLNKQCLIFVNTKRSAEKTAEEIAKNVTAENPDLLTIALDAKSALSSPTHQCERLSFCLRKGIAFHHSGLAAKQREIIEEKFKEGVVKIICCTPTLAYGLDLPAFRVIIKDLKRFGRQGLAWIPVLDYLQQAGRAGRPKYDSRGEAIAIAQTDSEKEKIIDLYIHGEPEPIHSKLAVEPALRMYLLSLIATEMVSSKKEIFLFFEKTFWAHQYQDSSRLETIIERMLELLEEWEFIRENEEQYRATPLGNRVSQLYIDPFTAFQMTECLRRAASKTVDTFSFLQMISYTLEMRPLVKVKTKEFEEVQTQVASFHEVLITEEPGPFDAEYDEFLDSFKTALMLHEWMNEQTEEFLLENFSVRPGELQAKLDIAEWLLYTAQEMSTLMHFQSLHRHIAKARFRIKYGAKEELFALLRLENIGRVRARKLFAQGIKDLGDVKKADIEVLARLLGKGIAQSVKKQVGQPELLTKTLEGFT